MKKSCCIMSCKNSNIKNANEPNNRNIKYYCFPSNNPHMPWLRKKRMQWINAVKKYVKHSHDWEPTKSTLICSAHFVGNQKSENPTHPSYIPTIFGNNALQRSMLMLQRWKRQHRAARLEVNKSNIVCLKLEPIKVEGIKEPNEATRSIACQTDECSIESSDITYFMCNMNTVDNSAEVQVNIAKRTGDIPKKIMKDSGCDPIAQSLYCPGFYGIKPCKVSKSVI